VPERVDGLYVLFTVYRGAGEGSTAADLALGLEEMVDASVGYGEPVPYRGTRRPEELLRLYSGTLLRNRSSGTCRSSCEVILGETAGTLPSEELLDLAEEDLGRELVIVLVARASSYIQITLFEVCGDYEQSLAWLASADP